MRFKVLNEHYLNFWQNDREKKEQYADVVMDILDKSYANIGGAHTSKDEIVGDNIYWKLVKRDGKIVAASLYKIQGDNRKLMVCGSDGSKQGKDELKKILLDDVTLTARGAYAEVSEAIEHIMVDKYNCKKVPVDVAEKVLAALPNPKKILDKKEDGYHYDRKIGNDVYTKIMVGNVPKEFE